MRSQYLRYPVGFGERLYLVSHQSLFAIKDGEMYRLCDFKSEIKDIKISEDGTILSFFSREESNGDVYCYRIGESSITRVTYFDDPGLVNVKLNSDSVVVSSNSRSACRNRFLYQIDIKTKRAQKLPYADAAYMASTEGKIIVQRFGYGYHMWRGYKGGMAARLYLFEPEREPVELKLPEQNAHSPIFVDNRLFFITDLDFNLNIYEYDFAAKTHIQRTFHKDYCVRDISAFGTDKILYSCGGRIYEYDLSKNEANEIEINGWDYSHSDSSYNAANPIEYLTSCSVNDKGEHISVNTRGQGFVYSMPEKGFWGSTSGIRYRHSIFLSKNILLQVKDQGDSSIFETYDLEESAVKKSVEFKVGNVREIEKLDENRIVVRNHKASLFIANLENGDLDHVVRGKYNEISGFDISPDGKWLAYSITGEAGKKSRTTTNAIYLYNIEAKESYKVTHGSGEWSPSFSKDGHYLYFLSDMEIKPKYDSFYFNLYFTHNTSICALCLHKNAEHPFKPWLHDKSTAAKAIEPEAKEEKKADSEEVSENKDDKKLPEIVLSEIVCVKSDLPSGHYIGLAAISDSKLLLITKDEEPNATLQTADLATNNMSTIVTNVEYLSLSNNREWMVVSNGEKLRVGKAGEQFDDSDKSYRDGGWVNLAGLNIAISPRDEWDNILFETWWLIKEKFWHKDMNNLDWSAVLEKYQRLMPTLRSREDLNLVLEELVGENGTSHNYIYDRGDNDRSVHPRQGYLAAKVRWNDGYEVIEIDNLHDFDGFRLTPLAEPGVKMQVGDVILEIDGVKCKEDYPIEHYLQYKGNKKVFVTYRRDDKRHITTVRPLASIQKLKYREWVNTNRTYIHKKTHEKVGYIHIPDMSSEGFMEFHKAYNQERNCDAIIIDVRNNGGGHVSSLIIKILLSVQTGFDISQDQFLPYPEYSNRGKFVLLCNEYCGSDGDVFTYMFRKYKLGEIVGRRTWGGVVGIDTSGRYRFIDRGYTTQPGYALVQTDVGLTIENKGVEPDYDIKTPPLLMTEWPENDPQLNKALEIITGKLDESDPEEEMFERIYGGK